MQHRPVSEKYQREVKQPPQFTQLIKAFEADKRSERLRLGQWFLVVYMPGENNPKLFYSTNRAEQLELIRKYYVDYQWE
jgi:hypothetical protein